MNIETQTMLPENAEPVYQLWSDEGFGGWTDTDKATYCWWLDSKNPPRMRKLYTAPVAAQPGLTKQTLDDVMAGIPARDAEIEALRKEIEALQAVLAQPQRLIFPTMLRKMWSGSEVQAWLDDELAKLTKSSSQQDADKVDAERYRAWRDAAVANSTPFVRAMRDTLPPEAREGKPRWPTAAEWDAAIDAARKEPDQ